MEVHKTEKPNQYGHDIQTQKPLRDEFQGEFQDNKGPSSLARAAPSEDGRSSPPLEAPFAEQAVTQVLSEILGTAEYRGCSDQVAHYAGAIAAKVASRYGLPEAYPQLLQKAAAYHDIGLTKLPAHIIEKPGPLNPLEFAAVKDHVSCGADLADRLTDLLANQRRDRSASHHPSQLATQFTTPSTDRLGDLVVDHSPTDSAAGLEWVDMLRYTILLHHERLDGSGYPFGLKAESIPLEARIVAVADVYSALISPRPYREAWDAEVAMDYLLTHAGNRFCPDCVDALVEALAPEQQAGIEIEELCPNLSHIAGWGNSAL